jgi:hypothetical protein
MTAVNEQITDAVTQTNVKVLGESPAMAMGNLYQATSSALAASIQNATFAQQQSNMVHQAATTQGISLIGALDTAAEGEAASQIAHSDTAYNALIPLLLKALTPTS